MSVIATEKKYFKNTELDEFAHYNRWEKPTAPATVPKEQPSSVASKDGEQNSTSSYYQQQPQQYNNGLYGMQYMGSYQQQPATATQQQNYKSGVGMQQQQHQQPQQQRYRGGLEKLREQQQRRRQQQQQQQPTAGRKHPKTDISTLADDVSSSQEVMAWRKKNEIRTAGGCPDPFTCFEQADLPAQLMTEIKKAGFTTPSLIQAQSWPAVLEKRDVVGVAKTGSGKTLGFLVPAFLNVMSQQHRTDLRRGPLVLVLAPTRELATQIRAECQKFFSSSRIM